MQRQSRFEDGVALRRADAVESQIGALLELDVDHRAGKLGRLDEHPLLVVVVRQAIFARVLIGCEHAPRQVGIGFEKLLAGIEDAVSVGVLVAIKQPRAVFDLRLRHHRIESGPSIDVAANECGLAVRMLQQHLADVLFAQADREQSAHQEDVWVGAAGDRHALALEVFDLRDRVSFLVTSAVHSGCE